MTDINTVMAVIATGYYDPAFLLIGLGILFGIGALIANLVKSGTQSTLLRLTELFLLFGVVVLAIELLL